MGVGMFIWLISLLVQGEFIWFVLLLFFGIGLITQFLSFLQMPFLLINAYFIDKIESIDFDEDVVTAEILDENNEVIGLIEGDTKISLKLATYFVIFFLFNLMDMVLFPPENQTIQTADYLITPTLKVLGGTFFLGLPYGLYRKVKHGSFFPYDKRYFFINIWKFWLILLVIMLFITIILMLTN